MTRPATIIARLCRFGSPLVWSALTVVLLIGCGSGGKTNESSTSLGDTTPILISESQTSVALGGTVRFSALQQNAAITGGQWSVQGGAANGSIGSSGLYQAPSEMPAQSTVTIAYTTSTNSATASITILSSANLLNSTSTVLVQATQATVQIGGTDQFTATEQGQTATGGEWAVFGGTPDGSISPSGLYQAPSVQPNPSTVMVGYLLNGQVYSANITVGSGVGPTISAITPGSVQSLSSSIQITGTLYSASSVVSINGSTVPTTFVDADHLAASITLAAPLNAQLQVVVTTPGYGQSAPFALPAVFPAITVNPAQLAGGSVTLTVTGANFNQGTTVSLNGNALATNVVSSTQITATGFLPPWVTGNVLVEVLGVGGAASAALNVPIAPTAVTFDAAARFASQAAMGPRPDVVMHIQQIGFDQFITDQFALPGVTYTMDPFRDYLQNTISGNSLLRQRVALALQSFIVCQDQDFAPSVSFFESMLENDAGGNFRPLLTDIAENNNLGWLLNLANNQVATSAINQPNQNFGRELMQLFSIGPMMLNDDGSQQLDSNGDPIPAYTQDTVIDLTRALTGWRYGPIINSADVAWGVDWSQPMTGNDSAHDHNAKLLFGTVAMPAGQNIFQDQTQALDAVFNHPNVPPFISYILIQHLVKSNPTPAYIQRISAVFEDDGNGVRGNMQAVVRAILEDPEARQGDTSPSPSDGFLQEPLLTQTFATGVLQSVIPDDQTIYLPKSLGETWWNSPTIFGYYSPYYIIPGTTVHSPEFMLWNNIFAIQRSEALWGIVSAQGPGFSNQYFSGSWLFQNFTTIPQMVEALNHLLYHGQMPSQEQEAIINYCAQLNPFETQVQLETAIFLALNGDSYNVVQ
jgi:hypothetical protein